MYRERLIDKGIQKDRHSEQGRWIHGYRGAEIKRKANGYRDKEGRAFRARQMDTGKLMGRHTEQGKWIQGYRGTGI